MYDDIPQLALSIMNPWAWLIAAGLKDIENRNQRWKLRGPFAIHAGKTVDGDAMHDLAHAVHPVSGEPWLLELPLISEFKKIYDGADSGGIIGVGEIVDCVEESCSPWFVGRYGLVIRNPRLVPFIPVRGMQGFFDWRRNLKAAD